MNHIKLNITSLSTHGEGIARLDGKTVFVPFVLPGESCEAEILESRKNFDRTLPQRLLEDSEKHPARFDAPCPYFGRCGGCQLQHIDYPQQLLWKREWLEETFRRVGHIDIQPNPVIASPPYEYRNKTTIPVVMQKGEITLAYHEIYRPARFVAVEDCPISHGMIRQAIPHVIQALREAQPRLERHTKDESQGSRVVFRVINGRLSLQMMEMKFSLQTMEAMAQRLLHGESEVEEIFILPPRAVKTKEPYKRYSRLQGGAGAQPESFLQINDEIRNRLYDYVLGLPLQNAKNVLDGYCGVGILTRKLAKRFERVVGVESNASSVQDALRAVEEEKLADRIDIRKQRMEDFLRKNREYFDAMVLNPPRAGLSQEVCERVAHQKPQELIIISCHPAALARDIRMLVDAGFRIESLQPFDMFPQTYHYEVVAVLNPY